MVLCNYIFHESTSESPQHQAAAVFTFCGTSRIKVQLTRCTNLDSWPLLHVYCTVYLAKTNIFWNNKWTRRSRNVALIYCTSELYCCPSKMNAILLYTVQYLQYKDRTNSTPISRIMPIGGYTTATAFITRNNSSSYSFQSPFSTIHHLNHQQDKIRTLYYSTYSYIYIRIISYYILHIKYARKKRMPLGCCMTYYCSSCCQERHINNIFQ
jgi:hypothetical protein